MSEQPDDVQNAWEWTGRFPRFRWAYRRLVHIFREELARGEVDYEDIFSQLERTVTKVPIPEFVRRGMHRLPPKRKPGEPLPLWMTIDPANPKTETERQIFAQVDEMFRNPEFRNFREMEERLPVWKALDPVNPKTKEEEEIFPLAVELMEKNSKRTAVDQCDDGTLRN
jgi:hypothetical protein